jgi:hypothetical protein
MTRTEYLRIKAELANIDDALREGHLTPEERAEYGAMSVTLSKQLVAPWIPIDSARRSMALGLFSMGLYGLVGGLEFLMWGWPLIFIFSPRVMGEHFHSVGRHSSNHSFH